MNELMRNLTVGEFIQLSGLVVGMALGWSIVMVWIARFVWLMK